VRILLLSDIHGNLEALEACLAAAPQYDSVANLGDIVGYGGSPNEVTVRARGLGSLFVRGNHDKACTGPEGLEYFNPIAAWAAMWTQENLTPENYEWLRALPSGPLPLGDAQSPAAKAENGDIAPVPVYTCHGSPGDEDEYIISIQDALDVLMRSSTRLTFFGHTHIQGGFSLDVKRGGLVLNPMYVTPNDSEQLQFPLEPTTKYLINPGSVGQPRDGDWRAGFALFDTDAYAVTFFRVPYNVEAAQQHIYDANLPDRLALRLKEGR
jgi:diadenosine tetraphosphatase ApaH/serine/threonine PP2A family protein phosphatase